MSLLGKGIILLVYLFIITLIYLIISTPFDNMVTRFDNIDLELSDDEVADSVALSRLVFDMVFGIAAFIPIVWFITAIFKREPDWQYYMR